MQAVFSIIIITTEEGDCCLEDLQPRNKRAMNIKANLGIDLKFCDEYK